MKILCPQCRRAVPPEQVNIGTDLAFCQPCNNAFRVSESVDVSEVNTESLQNPPKGAWFRESFDKTVVGASTRSPSAFILVPFMCVWSGFSLGGIYGSQFLKGQFNLGISLFGIPFVLGSILFWTFALMAICGKVEVTIGKESAVFVGIGPFGWTRRFDWPSIKTIREEYAGYQGHQGSHFAIVLEGKERLKFGSGLNEKRRYFVLNALKHLRLKNC